MFLIETGIYSQHIASAPHNGHCSLNRLLHNVTQLARMRCLALPGDNRCFNGQQITADFSPCQSRHLTDSVFFIRTTETKPFNPDEFLKPSRRNQDSAPGRLQQDLFDYLAADIGNFPFKIPYPGLAGVVTDYLPNRGLTDGDLFRLESVLLQLFRYQIFICNVNLFIFGIT